MPDRLFIGVDGGQSSTRTVLGTETGEILSAWRSGPCNHIHEPGGLERQYRELRAGYEGVFRQLGKEPEHVAGVSLGVTGSGHLETVKSVYDTEDVFLTNDAVTAHAGALAGDVGAIVIGGTGSIAYGRNVAGETCFVGGWGYLIGDEGSAYDIGRQALRVIYRAGDGRMSPTLLSDLLLAYFECDDLKMLHRRIYAGEISRDKLAGGTRVVAEAARQGDVTARQLLVDAGVELGLLLATALHQLGLGGAVKTSYIGGVFNAGGFIMEPMQQRLKQDFPDAIVQPPTYPPVIGSFLLALERGGIKLDHGIFENIGQTLGRLNQIGD